MAEVLIKSHGLQLFSSAYGPTISQDSTKDRKRTTLAAIFAVLDHIARRTLPFDKFLEFVTCRDIISGFPSLAIPPALVGRDLIIRTLSCLGPPHLDVLIKIRFVNESKLLYGINFPVVLPLIYDRLIEDLRTYYEKKMHQGPSLSIAAASTLGQAYICREYLEQYRPAFKLLSGIKGRINPADLGELISDIKAEMPRPLLLLEREEWQGYGYKKAKLLNHNWQESMRKGRPFAGNQAP